MPQTAQALSPEPQLEYGVVQQRDAAVWTVRTAHGRYTAQRAKSCLLAPDLGDSVLLCTDALGNSFILAVLCGAQDAGTLEFQGDLRLQVRQGDLSLATERELRLTADTCAVTAREGRATLGAVQWLAETVQGQCRRLTLAAQSCEQSLHSLSQRLGSLFRSTAEHEEVQSVSRRVLVEENHVLQCKNSVLLAEEDARIDAEQIHLG